MQGYGNCGVTLVTVWFCMTSSPRTLSCGHQATISVTKTVSWDAPRQKQSTLRCGSGWPEGKTGCGYEGADGVHGGGALIKPPSPSRSSPPHAAAASALPSQSCFSLCEATVKSGNYTSSAPSFPAPSLV